MLTPNQRIFSYSTTNDRILLLAASAASLCTGVTLPLMNVVLGRFYRHSKLASADFPGELVGVFGAFYDSDSGLTADGFLQIINKYV